MPKTHHVRRHWHGDMVWDGRIVGQNDHWITHLSDSDIAAIQTALNATKASGKPIKDLQRSDYQFGEFGQRLLALREGILNGCGYALLRGLPGQRWSDEDLIRVYWGIGAWLGDPVSQNAKAHLLGHVIDQQSNPAPDKRLYQTNLAQPFHSDSCDIVGLLCLRSAKSGGASFIASTAAIHNDLLNNNQPALERLHGEFQCDRFGEIPKGKQPYYSVRIFNEVNQQFVCCGMDPDIRSAQRLDGVTPLSTDQTNALDAFQDTARRLCLKMMLQRGDIQLVNNHTIVHARETFTDHSERERRRYLVRLWLSSKLARALPEFMAQRWGNIATGTVRGGIRVAGAQPVVTLNPDS